jgi:hypothetical protein
MILCVYIQEHTLYEREQQDLVNFHAKWFGRNLPGYKPKYLASTHQ